MGKVEDDAMSNSSTVASIDNHMMYEADYAPSPNTCSQALTRANQLRVQALLRQLITGANNQESQQRLDTLRLLRKTIRKLEYHLSWLTQVDFLETIERILREENDEIEPSDWRLINDSTQLLIESIPRFAYEVDVQTMGQILVTVVQNLGHQRSEVRRSSLLLINMYLNERPGHFQHFLKIFIDYGLANHRNQQAQRGAILSLPLLMTSQVVEGEDLLPLIKCLSELLVDSNTQLFYSLYLALQRLHMTVGDQQFSNYLRQCNPEASLLYKQAASRNNSIAAVNPEQFERQQKHQQVVSDSTAKLSQESQQQQQQKQQVNASRRESHCSKPPLVGDQESSRSQEQTDGDYSEPKQVTFEGDKDESLDKQQLLQQEVHFSHSSPDDTSNGSFVPDDTEDEALELPSDQQELLSAINRQMKPAEEDNNNNNDSYSAKKNSQTISSVDSSGGGGGNNSTGNRQQFKQLSTSSKQSAEVTSASSVSSTTSSKAHLVNPTHYMSNAALCGRPMSNYDIIHHVDHSNTGLAINDMGTCCSPTFEIGPAAENELKFGIFPRQLVTAALNSRYTDRIEALQEMMCIIRDSPINHLAILMTYFDSFLEQFLTRLMEPGIDYKVELIAIDMIETIVIKTKISTMQYVRPMIGLLIKTLGDSRAIFRDNTIRVLHKMMAFVPPQHVIDAIFEHKHSKSALIREESVNRVTAAVLEYDKNEFNLTKLCYHVLPMLADNNANVRLASLECIATIANALGQERIGSLLTAAEAVQTGCDYDGLLDAIHTRLMRRTLPRCNLDGSIRYVIKPFLNLANANYHQEHQAADVCWVLEAPSSHQHIIGTATATTNKAPDTNINSPLPEQLHLRLHHAHPQHRPGVYSPPDLSQRRASVAVSSQLQEISHQHGPRKHTHTHTHTAEKASSQQQDELATPEKSVRRVSVSPTQTAISDSNQQLVSSKTRQTGRRASRADISNANQTIKERRPSLYTTNLRGEPLLTSNRSEINNASSNNKSQGEEDSNKYGDLNSPSIDATGSEFSPPKMGRQNFRGNNEAAFEPRSSQVQRSNSQDSLSSTDTNKVLFKYYLGKFKQSLTDTTNGTMHSVLPSDSIIYTDTLQAYALSRHQSRQQQTSFDYDSDSVGRVPDARPKSRQHSKSKRNNTSLNQSNSLNKIEPDSNQLSSDSDSPLTVMENSHGQDKRIQKRVEKRLSKQASSREEVEDSGLDRPESLKRKDEEEEDGTHQRQQLQQPAVERRKSISSKHQQSYRSHESRSGEVAGDEGGALETSTLLRRKSVTQRQEAEESSDMNRDPEIGELHLEDHKSNRHFSANQRQKANLVRQSASAAAVDEDSRTSKSNELTRRESKIRELQLESDRVEQQHQQQQQQQQQQPVSSSQRDTYHKNQAQDEEHITRQESVSTMDSQKSQHSDSATQTVDEVRQSRRRRSRRSSSKRRGNSRDSGHLSESQQAQEYHDAVGDRDSIQHQAETNDLIDQGQLERDNEDELFEVRKRASRSQPPVPRQMNRTLSRSHLRDERATVLDSRRAASVSPSVAANVNIRNVLENVAPVEGPFQEPQLAFKVAMDALEGPCWSTKVEGILAIIRLVTFHQPLFIIHLHEIIGRIVAETRNLRSTVARSAIFALGYFSAKLERLIEPELEIIVQSLLLKSIENTTFIRDDIRKAFSTMLDHVTQWRFANALIHHGSNHKNMHVRRMASQFVALLVERMGPTKCLIGAREISAQLVPATAKFAQDSSPHTRYYGRLILAKLLHHNAFDRLLRKNLAPNMYRSTIGIIESVKRRGPGEAPPDN